MRNLVRWTVKRAYRTVPQATTAQPLVASEVGRAAFFLHRGVGDGVLARPAVELLARHAPQAAVDVFVPRGTESILSRVFQGRKVRPFNAAVLLETIVLRGRYDIAFANTIAAFSVTLELACRSAARRSFGFRYEEEPRSARLYEAPRAMSAKTGRTL